ncbi:MAG: hypothetical protein U5L74_06630 [Ideonella sp.]|nr:hypothetical protein [Ideonella sp.]
MNTDTSNNYQQRRGEIETYFDRTAVKAWERLTSTDPVGRIRSSVRRARPNARHPAGLAARRRRRACACWMCRPAAPARWALEVGPARCASAGD